MRSLIALCLFLTGSGLAQDASRLDQIVQSYASGRKFTGTSPTP